MTTPRHLLVPNANSPELLGRLLDMVGRGVRSTRGLSEALGVEPRTVHYYAQAGAWLGLLADSATCELTPLGLEYVYAGSERPRVYARAVWSTPLIAELLDGSEDALPDVASVARAVQAIEPEMAPSTVRRRAGAIRALIAPALGLPRASPAAHQLGLPFGQAAPPPRGPALEGVGAGEHDPDAYRYLLGALLDHGELELSQVRGLLDRAGAPTAPLGGYVAMAIARGDARRVDGHLVLTATAARRAELVDSTTSIILSDPGYRGWLDDNRLAATDRRAADRRDQAARRYRAWDRRLLGRPLDPLTVDRDLDAVLLDRPLASFPLAVPGGVEPDPQPGPFLDRWQSPNLLVACPPSLTELTGGVTAVNRLLRLARERPDDTRPPSVVDRRRVAHGGLLHPGEPTPRAVPDTRSLRARVLAHAPYMALAGALLLAHRQRPDRLAILSARARWQVRVGGRPVGPLLDVLDGFARARGWTVARRPGGLPDGALLDALQALGVASVVGRQAVLSERFFAQLREAPEETELHARLGPVAAALADHLSLGPGRSDGGDR